MFNYSNMNRKATSENPFQGTYPRVLCVCSAGLLRSPTAAAVLHKEYGYNTRSCGISTDFALIPLDEALLYWADKIVVMEPYMEDVVNKALAQFNFTRPVVCLGIPDSYPYMHKDLVDMIILKYQQKKAESQT